MDAVKVQNVKAEKANAFSRYRRTQKLTTLFRIVELFVFLIIVSRFSTQFAFSFNLSGEFRGISVTVISPRFVFLVGNAIIVLLFLLSGPFSAKTGEKIPDFYDEYVEKCRSNNQQVTRVKHDEIKLSPEAYGLHNEKKIISRSRSDFNLERRAAAAVVQAEERRRDLRRSVSQKCRKSVDSGRKKAVVEDEMSGEEFRRTVEAFIARQQRVLREEEEEFTALVSV